MATGRYKLGDQGVYFDPNDSGPDQASPDQIQQYQQSQAPAPPAPPTAVTSGSGDFSGQIDQPISNTGNSPYGSQLASTNTGVNGGAIASGAQVQPSVPANQPGQSGPWNGAGVPAGFDATKWNDPTKNDPKYDVGHMVASGWGNEQIAQWMQSHPQEFQGYSVTGTDKITGPDGTVYDFRNGVGNDPNGQGTAQWTAVSGPGGVTGSAGIGSASGQIGSGVGTGVGVSGVNGTAPSNSAFSDQVRQLLLQQLGGDMGTVTANDPQIKAEMDAQDAALARNQRDQRAAAAERDAMNGLLNGGQSSGAFDQELNSEFENKGQQLTGLQAQLFTQEIQRRSQQANQLLQMALSSGDQESARQLQAYLAQLDNAYRYAALGQNQSQFNDQFGLNAAQFQYLKDSQLAQYGAGY